MKYYKYVLLIIIGVVIVPLFVFGCGRKKAAGKLSWKTDIAPLEKIIPMLTQIESCIWQSGKKTNYSERSLPAPEEYGYWGYIQISGETSDSLLKSYKWENTQIDESNLNQPSSPSIADIFFKSRNFLESRDFMREHTKTSPYSKGKIVLNPEEKILYFDISNL